MTPMTNAEFTRFTRTVAGSFCYIETFTTPPGTQVRFCHVMPGQCLGYGFTMVS